MRVDVRVIVDDRLLRVTSVPAVELCPDPSLVLGFRAVREVICLPVDLDELWTIDEAVTELAKVGIYVKPGTLRVWIHRGHLAVAERDKSGRLRLLPLAVARAEYATRTHAGRVVGTRAA